MPPYAFPQLLQVQKPASTGSAAPLVIAGLLAVIIAIGVYWYFHRKTTVVTTTTTTNTPLNIPVIPVGIFHVLPADATVAPLPGQAIQVASGVATPVTGTTINSITISNSGVMSAVNNGTGFIQSVYDAVNPTVYYNIAIYVDNQTFSINGTNYANPTTYIMIVDSTTDGLTYPVYFSYLYDSVTDAGNNVIAPAMDEFKTVWYVPESQGAFNPNSGDLVLGTYSATVIASQTSDNADVTQGFTFAATSTTGAVARFINGNQPIYLFCATTTQYPAGAGWNIPANYEGDMYQFPVGTQIWYVMLISNVSGVSPSLIPVAFTYFADSNNAPVLAMLLPSLDDANGAQQSFRLVATTT